MAAALKLVKRELGAEAVILHTRTFRRGGVMGFGAKRVVEVTASTEVSIVPPRMRKRVLADDQRGSLPREPAPTRAGAGNVLRSRYGMGAAQTQPTAAVVEPANAVTVDVAAAPATTARPADHVTDEIRQIRRMVTRMMRDKADQPRPDMPDQLFNEYLALLEQEVTQELADEIVQGVRSSLTEKQLSSKRSIRNAVAKQVAKLIPTDKNAEPDADTKPADGRPLTIALVGPTGVGKTTTLAKLAATFKLKQGKRVALITADTYRIAAVDQLRTYANIISLPLEVVASPDELKEKIAELTGYDVILIDTAGRSQRDDEKLIELSSFIAAADPHQVHLVLSSTCSEKVLMEAVERFTQVRIDRIIFTKLDEAVSFGVLLNVVRTVNKQLSYVTTGQEVPHQIEPGRSDRLAGLILGGSV